MNKRNIIVIGASAGGFEVLKTLVAALPADMDASIFIVWHMSPDVRGILPHVLNRQQTLFAAHAINHEIIKPGKIYIAPPDHHMLIDGNEIRVTKGPKENRFRPAIDPLFRSAAQAYGSRVIGIILSGALDDGTAGLWTIKKYRGLAIVQTPDEADVPSMPENAIRQVAVDYIVPVAEMPALLLKLINTTASGRGLADPDIEEQKRDKIEVNIALEDKSFQDQILNFGSPSAYTCPECHGVLMSLQEGGHLRFRCHTGHAFSADSLLAAVTESIEENLWSAVRNIQESVILLNHMGDHFAEINQPKMAAAYFKKAMEAKARAGLVRDTVWQHEQLSLDSILKETSESDNSAADTWQA
jgi:two-component system chemotaxis response regulator CheB